MREFNCKKELERSINSLSGLSEYLQIGDSEMKNLEKVVKRHPMRITKYYMSLIEPDNPNDPIRKMAIPSEKELNMIGAYDTSGERDNTMMPGLQHKYGNTALILATTKCANYCRYCFRKRMVGLSSDEILKRFSDAVEYIRKHGEINNVLLSGGDPFVLSTRIIKQFLEKLLEIPHIDFVRIGTRVPVVFPERIINDGELLRILKEASTESKKIYITSHFNHPKEITDKSAKAVELLRKASVITSNHAVLLKGVNDNPEILVNLHKKLISIGVIPYYLFQCRPVKRVKENFQVPLRRGYQIVEEAKSHLDGYSKRFKYVMSHKTGKIEILGIMDGDIYLKYHQAKNPENTGRLLKRKINDHAGWLDDLI